MSEYHHILWSLVEPYGPYICKREEWKQCPEHAHLTDKRPSVKFKVEIIADIDGTLEANVDSVSWDEYNSSDNVEVNVLPSATGTDSSYVVKTFNVKGRTVDAASLTEMGHSGARVHRLFNRPTAGDKLPPNEEQLQARVEFAVAEAKFYAAAKNIADKKFRFPSFGNREERLDFYRKEMSTAMNAYEEMRDVYQKIETLEQPKSHTGVGNLNYTADVLDESAHLANASGLHFNLRRSFTEMEKDDKFRMKVDGLNPSTFWRKS